MKLSDFDNRDTCLQVSLYCAGKIMSKTADSETYTLMNDMIAECNLDQVFGHRKNSDYKWSNSGSENPSDNTLCKRPTKWLYDKVLSKGSVDPYKGLNTDQYRAFFIWLWLTRGIEESEKMAKNILVGMSARFGMLPSLMENALFKPQNFVLLFRMFWYTKPLYFATKQMFIAGAKCELKIDPEFSTTNKISMLPTMKLLGYPLPNEEYIRRVYNIYFGERPHIAESIINGLLEGENK